MRQHIAVTVVPKRPSSSQVAYLLPFLRHLTILPETILECYPADMSCRREDRSLAYYTMNRWLVELKRPFSKPGSNREREYAVEGVCSRFGQKRTLRKVKPRKLALEGLVVCCFDFVTCVFIQRFVTNLPRHEGACPLLAYYFFRFVSRPHIGQRDIGIASNYAVRKNSEGSGLQPQKGNYPSNSRKFDSQSSQLSESIRCGTLG
jgi:hypothetical protein